MACWQARWLWLYAGPDLLRRARFELRILLIPRPALAMPGKLVPSALRFEISLGPSDTASGLPWWASVCYCRLSVSSWPVRYRGESEDNERLRANGVIA